MTGRDLVDQLYIADDYWPKDVLTDDGRLVTGVLIRDGCFVLRTSKRKVLGVDKMINEMLAEEVERNE